MKSHLSTCLLLDVSASMRGPRLQALYESYDLTLKCVARVFQGWDKVLVSALSYESTVTPLFRNEPLGNTPKLPVFPGEGATCLTPAFQLLGSWLQEDISRGAVLVILIADGMGTDNWLSACRLLDPYHDQFLMVGLGCGKSSSLVPLYHISHEKQVTDVAALDELFWSEMPLLQRLAAT